uniref:GW182 middle domain-containing protein n=1 Tax=Onchocerca volvulus TaxID=6282 RepID=A0A8R1XTW2_ONCVO
MWAPIESSQAETASLNSWSIEQQQNRWGGVSDYSNNAAFDEHMRSIVPPAFRNSNAKVVWQEPKSLEANINETLGIWQATPLNQFSLEQEPLSGTNHFPPSFAGCGAANGWSQPEIEQRSWDMSTQSQTVRAAVPFCGGLTQNKLWPNDEQVWGGAQRPPVFPTGPPPPAYAASWQQNAPRGNVFPLSTRFNSPPFESNAVMGNWVQRSMNEPVQPPVPPSSIPPPQRSRLQNVWGGTPAVNNTVNGMYLPPPTVEYSMPNGLTQWNPSTGSGGAVVTAVPVGPKPQFTQNFVNRSPPPSTFNSYSQVSKSDSFMGENAVWQDPEGEVRKWQRDTGTAAWGDPEKQQKEIKRWLIPAGKEYDNSDNESIRAIAPLGWGDLPSKTSSNNAAPISTNSISSWPTKSVPATIATASSNAGWNNRSTSAIAKSVTIPSLWEILSDHQSASLESGWMPSDGGNNAAMPASTQQIVEQLRQAVAKGLIDVSLLSKPLPNEALSEMRTLLSRIPVLEQAENDLARLMNAVKINNDREGGSGRMDTPTDLMTSEQRSEYSRLVIEIAATKTEISTIRERIRGNSNATNVRPAMSLAEIQRMQPPQPQPAVTTTTSPRFGDSILDVAVRVEQQKLFSM